MVGVVEDQQIAGVALAPNSTNVVAVGDGEVLGVLGDRDQIVVAGGDERLVLEIGIRNRLKDHAWLRPAPGELVVRNAAGVDLAREHIDVAGGE